MVTTVVRHRVGLIEKEAQSLAAQYLNGFLSKFFVRERLQFNERCCDGQWVKNSLSRPQKRGRKKFLGRASPDRDESAHRPGKIFDISEIYDWTSNWQSLIHSFLVLP